jgi:hypothetical protein
MTGVRPIYAALHNKSSIICAPQHLAPTTGSSLAFWIIPCAAKKRGGRHRPRPRCSSRQTGVVKKSGADAGISSMPRLLRLSTMMQQTPLPAIRSSMALNPGRVSIGTSHSRALARYSSALLVTTAPPVCRIEDKRKGHRTDQAAYTCGSNLGSCTVAIHSRAKFSR